MPRASALALVLAVVLVTVLISRVQAQIDTSKLLELCVTSNYGVPVTTDWCVFPNDYPVVGCVNNPLNVSALVPSSLDPSEVPSTGLSFSALDALLACNLGVLPGQISEEEARPCIEAFYHIGCQSVCRRYNPTAMLCFMDSAIFPASYCTNIEDKCSIFTNSSCLLSPQGDTYNLLKQTSCVGGQYTFGQQPNSEAGFPYVSADVDKIMSQLFPFTPSPVSPPPPPPTNTNTDSVASSTTLSLITLAALFFVLLA